MPDDVLLCLMTRIKKMAVWKTTFVSKRLNTPVLRSLHALPVVVLAIPANSAARAKQAKSAKHIVLGWAIIFAWGPLWEGRSLRRAMLSYASRSKYRVIASAVSTNIYYVTLQEISVLKIFLNASAGHPWHSRLPLPYVLSNVHTFALMQMRRCV